MVLSYDRDYFLGHAHLNLTSKRGHQKMGTFVDRMLAQENKGF